MNEIIAPLIFSVLWASVGYFYGYARAMRYCTKRLKEMGP